MADQFDDMMNKHFEAAGITDDADAKPNEEVNTEIKEEQKEEKTSDAFETAIDRAAGEEKPNEPSSDKKGDEGQKPADDKQGGEGNGNDGKSQQGQEQKEQGARNPNDLTLQDGTVVKAGGERRWYETARIARQEAGQAKQDAETWKQRHDAVNTKLEAFTEAAKQVGLEDPTKMQAAIRLYKDLGSDPVGTVKQLLVDVKAAGYSLDGIGSGVDTQAILNALDQLKQSKPAATVDARQEQIAQEVKTEVDSFFAANPDARIHEGFIAAVMEKHPEASLNDAYLAVKTQALEKGFDWSKDLGPQVQAYQAGQQGQQPQQEQAKPIVNGKSLTNATDHDPTKHAVQAESFEEAIKAGMRDAGLHIN